MGGGPKARHKPAQGKTASFAVAALGSTSSMNKALKGRHTLSRPFRALSFYIPNPDLRSFLA